MYTLIKYLYNSIFKRYLHTYFQSTLAGQKYYNTSEANEWQMTPSNCIIVRLTSVLSANGYINNSMKLCFKYNAFYFESSKSKVETTIKLN